MADHHAPSNLSGGWGRLRLFYIPDIREQVRETSTDIPQITYPPVHTTTQIHIFTTPCVSSTCSHVQAKALATFASNGDASPIYRDGEMLKPAGNGQQQQQGPHNDLWRVSQWLPSSFFQSCYYYGFGPLFISDPSSTFLFISDLIPHKYQHNLHLLHDFNSRLIPVRRSR